MEEHTLASIEARARVYVDSFSDAVLTAIVRGTYPAKVAAFSTKRREVYTRAALIVLDARAGAYPQSVEAWSKEALEKRITAIRSTVVVPQSTVSADDATRRREIASGVKLDPSWQATPIRLQGVRRHS